MFPYTPENLKQLEKCFSVPRLRRYMDMASGNYSEALEFYAWNIALSEAMLGPIQGLEVILRNHIHDCLTQQIASDWYDRLPFSWRVAQQAQIEKAKNQLRQSKGGFTPPQLIAELNFGFWIGILGRHYEMDLWRPYVHTCFPRLPKSLKRKDVHKALDVIRDLRNRIAHHEPILERDLKKEYELLLNIVDWMNPEGANWIAHYSRVLIALEAKPNR